MADGHDRSVSSRGGASGGGAASATGTAVKGVSNLPGKGGHHPLRSGRLALRTGDGHLFVAAPEEDLEEVFALPASILVYRHGFIPCSRGGRLSPFSRNVRSQS